MQAPAPSASAQQTAERRTSATPQQPGSAAAKRRVTTSVDKGEHGIGLDLGKSAAGEAQVLRLKDFPTGIVNPASLCNPPMLPNDVIVAVNGQSCATFADAVRLIRAANNGKLQLTLERS